MIALVERTAPKSGARLLADMADAEVVAIREERAATGKSWKTIARERNLHPKAVYRVCTGRTRIEAGGPIEGLNMDERQVVGRCGGCGCRLVESPCKRCVLIYSEAWCKLAIDVLRESGLVDLRQLDPRIYEPMPCSQLASSSAAQWQRFHKQTKRRAA